MSGKIVKNPYTLLISGEWMRLIVECTHDDVLYPHTAKVYVSQPLSSSSHPQQIGRAGVSASRTGWYWTDLYMDNVQTEQLE